MNSFVSTWVKKSETEQAFTFRTHKTFKRFLAAIKASILQFANDKQKNMFLSTISSDEFSQKEKLLVLFWQLVYGNTLFTGVTNEVFMKTVYQGKSSLSVISATSDGDKVALVKIEVITMSGNGNLNISGTNSIAVKKDIKNTYNYMRANKKILLSQQCSFANIDMTVQVTALLGSTVQNVIGEAVFTAIISSIFNKNLKLALGIIGNISIGGAIERAINFSDKVSILSENGAKTVLVPMDNIAEFSTQPTTILGKTDVHFYTNTQMII